MEKFITATGKTIDLAIAAALEQLGMDRDSVSVEVLENPRSGFLGIGSTPAKVKVTYEVPDEKPEAPAPALSSASRSKPKKPAAPAQEVAPSPAPTAVPSPLPTLAPLRMPALTGAVRPVSGGQVRGFSAEPVFWQGIDCWQAHPAADLAAESGETAVCMRDGTVLSAARDELWGWRVAVRQTDGSVCTYAGLACSLVLPGQTVTRGQPLGDVMEIIPAESELGAHIHLSLERDSRCVDPAESLPET